MLVINYATKENYSIGRRKPLALTTLRKSISGVSKC
jgi:hypothetical protein